MAKLKCVECGKDANSVYKVVNNQTNRVVLEGPLCRKHKWVYANSINIAYSVYVMPEKRQPVRQENAGSAITGWGSWNEAVAKKYD